MSLSSFIIRRILAVIPVLFGVTLCVFLLSHAIPGDPASMMAGEKASEETIERIRIQYGLDRPLYEQYFKYMGDLLRGDLGMSLRNQRPVLDDLRDHVPATLELALAAMLLCLVVGIPLGVLAAVKRDRLADHLTRVFSVIGVSTPVFWLGLMLLLIFYRDLGILPGSGRLDIYTIEPPSVTGMYTLDALISGDMEAFRDALAHLILPAFCLGYIYLAIITRIVRSSMLHSLEQDYVTTARANGLSEARVIGLHALRNSLIPTITIAGLSMGELMGGAILTETIFDWPGMGKYVVDSVNALDFPAIMGFTLVVALAYILINLCVDVLYAVINPQIRYRSGS
ncbi:MAG TPA: ABC transporter permease [Candidatus Mailhella merdavium]|nr:ABC transporter permease [Candidatus Mailhella merdavium]